MKWLECNSTMIQNDLRGVKCHFIPGHEVEIAPSVPLGKLHHPAHVAGSVQRQEA